MAEMTAYKMIPKCTKDEMLYVVSELVRCKDCRYAAPDMACTHESEWGNEISRNRDNPYWFCADGKRRGNNDGDERIVGISIL